MLLPALPAAGAAASSRECSLFRKRTLLVWRPGSPSPQRAAARPSPFTLPCWRSVFFVVFSYFWSFIFVCAPHRLAYIYVLVVAPLPLSLPLKRAGRGGAFSGACGSRAAAAWREVVRRVVRSDCVRARALAPSPGFSFPLYFSFFHPLIYLFLLLTSFSPLVSFQA